MAARIPTGKAFRAELSPPPPVYAAFRDRRAVPRRFTFT